MRRREFMTVLGGAVTTPWPLTARAQQSAPPVIGWLGAANSNIRLMATFRAALAEAGYIEGRNVVIEYRFAEGR
jgi:putative ABC transport system substrate-binding protein